MSPATIERRRLGMRDDEGQLSLDGLAPVARRAPARQSDAPAAPSAPAGVTAGSPQDAGLAPARPAAPAASAGGTLDDLITGVWRQLGAQRVAACPVCNGHLHAHDGARVGQCGSCGSSLS